MPSTMTDEEFERRLQIWFPNRTVKPGVKAQQEELSRQERAKKEQELLREKQLQQRAEKAKQKALAEISQMQAAFLLGHPHECKRCPERFSSNNKLHRHLEVCHQKKPPPTTPPSPLFKSKPPPSRPTTPEPAPPALEKPSYPAQSTEKVTPPHTRPLPPSYANIGRKPQPTPSPHREISTLAPSTPTKSKPQHETSLRVYLPPQKRAYITIAQLFTRFGSTWNGACSKLYQPIRKLASKAPIWTPSNTFKANQSGASEPNCTSGSASPISSAVSSISTSLPPKPPRQRHSAQPHWSIGSPPPSSSRKSLGYQGLEKSYWTGVIMEALAHLLGDVRYGYYGSCIV